MPKLVHAETLADLASKRNIKIAAFTFDPGKKGSAFESALNEFNLRILPVFMRIVEPQRGQFDFSMPDAVADAAPPGTVFYIPQLAWNDHNPLWLTTGNFSGPELKEILIEFVSTTVRHFETKYPGRVLTWEVAIEPLSWQGQPQCVDPNDSSKPCGGFWNKIGLDAGLDQYEYIRVAARTARAIVPHGKLYIQDFGAEDLGPKSDQFFKLISQLKSENVPLDGVGFEGHFMVESGGAFMQVPTAKILTENLNRFGNLGLKTMIASTDISILDSDVSSATLAQQAQGFRTILNACLSAQSCEAFGTWGVGDWDSWIPKDAGPALTGWGSPLLFDASYQPKPAYQAVKDELIQFGH
jgi:endo-1,4-beta-xylanase